MNIICDLFGHKEEKSVLAYAVSYSYMNVNVKIYDVFRCKRCGKFVQHLIAWYDTFCYDSSWKIVDKEKEQLRKNGIVSLSEVARIIEERN